MKPNWKGNREFLLAQVIRLTEQYLTSGRIVVSPPLFNEDEVRRRILYTLNMTKIVQHLWEAIRFENTLATVPQFDRNSNLSAWVKNDHLGFEIPYVYRGVVRVFRPDFLVRLTNGKTLVLEVNGQDDEQNKTKRGFLAEWVKAVNGQNGF